MTSGLGPCVKKSQTPRNVSEPVSLLAEKVATPFALKVIGLASSQERPVSVPPSDTAPWHVCRLRLQWGANGVHCASVTHSTQVWVTVSHAGAAAEQCALVRHCRQTCWRVSQISPLPQAGVQ